MKSLVEEATKQEMCTSIAKQTLLDAKFILHQVGAIDNAGVKPNGNNIATVPHISRMWLAQIFCSITVLYF